MYDRVIRLYDPQNPSATTTDEWLEAGLGAITLGNELLRLRGWLETEAHSGRLRASLQRVIDDFRCFFSNPQLAVAEVRKSIRELVPLDPGEGHAERRCWARVLGSLEEIDVYLTRHPKLSTIKPAIDPAARAEEATTVPST